MLKAILFAGNGKLSGSSRCLGEKGNIAGDLGYDKFRTVWYLLHYCVSPAG